ncbi:unnamed protein product [Plutella xylostella]|uniref:(diamondback moth) hypothetical protein n=1 Tax=Plutella xylostella TaxID=51655 RepID=A0A8S4GFP8_PLUXY|nr:unnamed protein product [Plutella xylostella]
MIVLSEINIKEHEVPLYNIPGFNSYHNTRSRSKGGGILIYVKETLQFYPTINNGWATEVTHGILEAENSMKLYVVAVYRPPKTNQTCFLDEIDNIMKSIPSNMDAVLLGDVNINIMNGHTNNIIRKYKDMMCGYGMQCGYEYPTREEIVDGRLVRSCIDHVWVRECVTVRDTSAAPPPPAAYVLSSDKISDHYLSGLCLRLNSDGSSFTGRKKTITVLDNKLVQEKLLSADWTAVLQMDCPLNIYQKKAIVTQISEFLENNNVLTKTQHGFRKHKSTASALSQFTETMYNHLDNRKHIVTIFIDFKKAFDTLEHDLLLQAMRECGVRGGVNSWLREYLTGRQMSTAVGATKSVFADIRTGVPTGSVFGPIGYIMHVNNVANVIHNCDVYMYADDMCIIYAHKDQDIIEKHIQSDLDSITKWAHDNGIIINISKTKGMHISSPHNIKHDVTAATENVNLVTEEENSQLDPEVLDLLGSDPTQIKEFGDDLHKEVANRWKHILLNGLTKEEKSELSKHYLPAENCAFIRPPKLNPEVKSALHDLNIKKDAYSEKKQDVMASCLSAIGKALNMTLTERHSDPELIKILSDAGRLLCDIHHRESVSRRFAIINAVNKSKRDTIKNTKIDHNLFGSNLTEHLKTSKAISVSASELRYNSSNHQHRAQLNTTMPRSQPALNVRGAPRAPVAEPRAYPRQPRRPPPPPAASARAVGIPPCAAAAAAGDTSTELQPPTAEPTPLNTLSQGVTSAPCRANPDGREIIRQALMKRGIPITSLNIMMASFSHNTLKQYNASLKAWWAYCSIKEEWHRR